MGREQIEANVQEIAIRLWSAWMEGGAADPKMTWEVAPKQTFNRMAVWVLDEIAQHPDRYLNGWKEFRKL